MAREKLLISMTFHIDIPLASAKFDTLLFYLLLIQLVFVVLGPGVRDVKYCGVLSY